MTNMTIKELNKLFAQSRMKMLSEIWFYYPPQSWEEKKEMEKEWNRLRRIV